MADSERTRLFRKKVIRPYRGRGQVYAWLRAHHARVSELVQTWAWSDLVNEMLRDGLQGRDGATPTPKAVTKVWQRVQRDIEAEPAKAAPIGGKYPSRISPDWRPQAAAPQPVRPSPPVPVVPSPAPVAPAAAPRPHGSVPIVIDIPEADRARVQAALDKAMDQLDEMGRKIYGP